MVEIINDRGWHACLTKRMMQCPNEQTNWSMIAYAAQQDSSVRRELLFQGSFLFGVLPPQRRETRCRKLPAFDDNW